jgi:hypothetical protein
VIITVSGKGTDIAVICTVPVGYCPTRAGRSRMRCGLSAMFRHDPANGVYSG